MGCRLIPWVTIPSTFVVIMGVLVILRRPVDRELKHSVGSDPPLLLLVSMPLLIDNSFDGKWGPHGMQCESNNMVNPAVGRKCTVSYFMSHTPPSGKDNTLTEPIESPGRSISKSSNDWGESKILNQRVNQTAIHGFLSLNCVMEFPESTRSTWGSFQNLRNFLIFEFATSSADLRVHCGAPGVLDEVGKPLRCLIIT